MKHLLSSIESGSISVSQASVDIRQLLTSVRDSRDSKSSEGFHDALEKILAELRSTEHAAPFLKPVRRSEAPGYDIVIKHPMDLGTMAKKVKNHQYKTQREFVDDLNLIWDNCLLYNSDPAHPLRRATVFMRKKADQALDRVLGNADRLQSVNIPAGSDVSQASSPSFAPPTGVNGKDAHHPSELSRKFNTKITNGKLGKPVNGITSKDEQARLPNGIGLHNDQSEGETPISSARVHKKVRVPMAFNESPAIIRSPHDMRTFRDLDRDMQRYLDSDGAGPSKPATYTASPFLQNGFIPDSAGTLREKLEKLIQHDDSLDWPIGREYQRILGSGQVRDKRPLGIDTEHPLAPAKKKPRFDGDSLPSFSSNSLIQDGQMLGLWWAAAGASPFLGSGFPPIPAPQARALNNAVPAKKVKKNLKSHAPIKAHTSPRKLGKLKSTIYKNIDALRRIRRTHSLLVASTSSSGPNSDSRITPSVRIPDAPPAAPPDIAPSTNSIPVEGGSGLAIHTLKSNCAMLLEHAGFESSSKAALDVITDVAAEFLMNVGRTLRFLCDQHADKMSAEEIILHTLFESGTTEVRQLERYIKDDVERYGVRLADLERKLDTAYKEQLEAEADVEDDDALFAEDGDALVSGDFSSALGEDFFGFRELGLDKEFGLSTLSIPSRLFHGHAKKRDSRAFDGDAPKEPILRFPPPPAFVPLSSRKLEAQIGLLQPFYKEKFEHVRSSGPSNPAAQPLTNPSNPINDAILLPVPVPAGSDPSVLPVNNAVASIVSLPDDPPNPLKTKMGPLGQVTMAAATATKKKSKAAAPTKSEPANGAAKPTPTAPSATSASKGTSKPPKAAKTNGAPAEPKKKKKPKKDQGGVPPSNPAALIHQPPVLVS